MIYDRVISDLNAARLRETSHPVFHTLIEASLSIAIDVIPLLLFPVFPLTRSQCVSRYPTR